MRSWEDVHRLHEMEGRSARDIARSLGMSRNTVRRLLKLSEPPRYKRIPSGPSLDPFRDTIGSLLEQNPRMPATEIRRRLTELGYAGGITVLKGHLATLRPLFQAARVYQRSSALPERIDRLGSFAHVESPEAWQADRVLSAESEPGMNLISSDFDIIMVNRTNERLFKKPMVEMLGKKCFWQFERRSEVCPHCPGAAALATGHPHRVEAMGIRDDGTKYAVRLTAYPILGPLGAPIGFVEVEEDITERRRLERLAELFEDLETSLTATHDMSSAIRQALNVAFSLEGVDFGCAYVLDPGTGEYRTVAQRGASRDLAEASARRGSQPVSAGKPSLPGAESAHGRPTVSRGPMAVALIPVVHGNLTVARLLLGSSAHVEFPPATQAALEGLGRIVGSAIANFRIQQLERDTRAEIEALIAVLPIAVWCVDQASNVTMWNRAAEQLFGWKAHEVLHCAPPLAFKDVTDDAETPPRSSHGKTGFGDRELECRGKDGALIRLRATVTPLPRVIGRGSSTMTIAERVDGELLRLLDGLLGRSIPSEAEITRAVEATRPASARLGATITLETEPAGEPSLHIVLPVAAIVQDQDPVQAGAGRDALLRLLVVHREDGERRALVRILRNLGCSVAVCDSSEQAAERYRAARRSGRPFDLVICELLMPVGTGGLDLAARLLKTNPDVKVILSADSPIVGCESHGLAGALRRPYTASAVRATIAAVAEVPTKKHATRHGTG